MTDIQTEAIKLLETLIEASGLRGFNLCEDPCHECNDFAKCAKEVYRELVILLGKWEHPGIELAPGEQWIPAMQDNPLLAENFAVNCKTHGKVMNTSRNGVIMYVCHLCEKKLKEKKT